MSSTHHDNTPTPLAMNPELRLMLQKYALDWAYSQHASLKDDIADGMDRGNSTKVKNDQGVELGAITMSNPAKRAVCTDDAVLLGLAEERGFDLYDTLPTASTDKGRELIAYLYEQGREDLLGVPTISNDDRAEVAAEVLEEWQVTGKVRPGWEITDASKPTLSVKKVTGKKAALAQKAVEHLRVGMADVLMIEEGK